MSDQSQFSSIVTRDYLKLDLGLSNILLGTTSTNNFLCFGDLRSDSVGAEVLKWESLDSIDAELGVWLDNGKASGNCSYILTVNPLMPS